MKKFPRYLAVAVLAVVWSMPTNAQSIVEDRQLYGTNEVLRELSGCSIEFKARQVIETYIDQISIIDETDPVQLHYIMNDEISNFVIRTLYLSASETKTCNALSILLISLIETSKLRASSLDPSSYQNVCSPVSTWRRCAVTDTDGDGLNLRVMPGVVNDLTRRSGFAAGQSVRAVCSYGDWALVYGDAYGSKERNYGWSHRKYLVCEPELRPSSSRWRG